MNPADARTERAEARRKARFTDEPAKADHTVAEARAVVWFFRIIGVLLMLSLLAVVVAAAVWLATSPSFSESPPASDGAGGDFSAQLPAGPLPAMLTSAGHPAIPCRADALGGDFAVLLPGDRLREAREAYHRDWGVWC